MCRTRLGQGAGDLAKAGSSIATPPWPIGAHPTPAFVSCAVPRGPVELWSMRRDSAHGTVAGAPDWPPSVLATPVLWRGPL